MNKPRLIDANKLHETLLLILHEYGDMELAGRILYHVNFQPTAYDIDKVINELLEHSQECVNKDTKEEHSYVWVFDAIEIVKGGLDESRNDGTSR